MRLRRRMIVSSSVQLLAVGALLALAYLGFRHSIVPILDEHLRVKTLDATNLLRMELDLPLAAQDPAMAAEVVDRLLSDPDLAYVEVRDVDDKLVVHRGVPARPRPPGVALTALPVAGGLVAWADVSLEGVALGHIEVGYSSARVDRIGTWARRFALIATLVWLAAFANALRFSREFVAPIRRMMEFSGRVAGGHFTEQLADGAPGELGELRDHLNRMARDLAEREQERRRSAVRAEEMRHELLAVSRMAGMAEVATGVLHNVGNVLNSLTTSVAVMSGQIRNSKVGALGKSLELYRDHPGGLPGFLATAKGQLLPRYLEKVAGQLAADNADVQRELESIALHVEHIATIVSTQQAYTRVGAIRDATDLGGVLDDALGMVEGSFERHRIEVVKDYQPVGPVVTDRHKVLQIVVNLIANARHAVREVAGPRIAVAVAAGPDAVAISVDDNGVGIPTELLAKVFQHGFTTKKDGHGFGLHHAANAAGELGGTLTVASSGAGCGARFTLTLPHSPLKVPDALAS